MAADPLDHLPEKYRDLVRVLMEKSRMEGYFQAQLENSATRLMPRSDPISQSTTFGPDPYRKRPKARKRVNKRGQAHKYVEEYFAAAPRENVTTKDVRAAIKEQHGIELDFTPIGRAIRGLHEAGEVISTGPKTWSSVEEPPIDL